MPNSRYKFGSEKLIFKFGIRIEKINYINDGNLKTE
jgi:hypothetical protein